MDMDLSWLVGIASTALAAGAGAYVSARLGVVHADQAENNRFRRETAEEIVVSLTKLRDLLRDVQNDRNSEQWTVPVITAYDTIDDARHRLPQRFQHLRQSVRFALGEAVGGPSLADLGPSSEPAELADYNHRWNEYAIEYIEMAVDSIREWRDASAKSAPNVRLPGFDLWLAKTSRHVTGSSAT
ncbi:hypothetical protein C3B61_13220 [Cryobacterium zongtaii]|uniref:Uncharacterized protein n=1 Tax=Cryobacterium zongtaii TaxID=1259217 RepID=A0A2S3ZDY5_9MICO|nr:hypothetical protein [Cryobacterium zongtaii]POH64402.1 hypothetical protein C3B61_13220 [Cryobacterium zongtaii]